jgi:hypothetical protein
MGLVVSDARVRWAGGVIPYEIDGAISQDMHVLIANNDATTDPAPKPGGCAQLSGPTLSPGDLAALHDLSPAGVWWGAVDNDVMVSSPAVCTAAYGQLRVFEQGGWPAGAGGARP